MGRKVIGWAAVLALVAAFAGAAGGIAVWEQIDEEPAAAPAAPEEAERDTAQPVSNGALTPAEIYERSRDGVVQVRVSGFGGEAAGSGFVIDDLGHVVTNQHVVGNASNATVVLPNGEERQGRVVGTDRSTDIALIEVAELEGLKALPLGSTADLSVGDPVVAIGSPFGLQGTVTSGIVSGLGREIRAPDGFAIDDVIQTDAALNSGNSGGPLLDGQGRVVGVNSQIESRSGGNVGVGFAVPIETAQSVVDQLLEDGDVEHAYLGVQLGDGAGDEGAPIQDVLDGTVADRAGLKAGDVVVRAGDREIQDGSDLRAIVSSRRPGDRLELEVRRDGETRTITVELGDRPSRVE